MKPKAVDEKPPLEWIEEAFHLVRTAGVTALVAYCLGALPFVLALLYFWAELAHSAFAEENLLPGVWGLTLLFLWMKTWQTVFAQHLHAHLCGETPPAWRLGWLLRAGVTQAAVQPAGLFLLPLALALALPFGWVYAFFNNAGLFAGDSGADLAAVCRRSWRQALLWPGQNHALLAVLSLFVIVVFANLFAAVLGLPWLAETLLGVESVFTRNPQAALNSTLVAAVAGLTYLCCDPLFKAVYVLRCFYGESLRTGQDLKVELRRCVQGSQPGLRPLLLLIVALASVRLPTAAAGAAATEAGERERAPAAPAAAPAGARLDSSTLDRSIDEIIQQREYRWRAPREAVPRKPANLSWLESATEHVVNLAKAAGNWFRELFRWLRQLLGSSGLPSPSSSVLGFALHALVWILILGLALLLIWALVRVWRERDPEVEMAAEALPPAPDLSDEAVGAEQMPEDGWAQLAVELLGRGELRLALRAFYLSTLAHLAQRNLITLARFKSNRDYEGELQRRAHTLAELPALFSENLVVFERVWYGRHEVTAAVLQEFSGRAERMKIP